MVTFEWIISQLDCAPHVAGMDHVVNKVHWRLLADDNGERAETYGDVCFNDAPNKATFTEYADLTKDMIIAWVEAELDASAGTEEDRSVAVLKKSLTDQLAARKRTVAPPPPW